MGALATPRLLELSSAAARLRASLAMMPSTEDVASILLAWGHEERQIDMARCALLIAEALAGRAPSWDSLDFIEKSAPALRSHARRMRRIARALEMGWDLEHGQEDHLGECCAMLNRMRSDGRISWPNQQAIALATRNDLASLCPVDGLGPKESPPRL